MEHFEQPGSVHGSYHISDWANKSKFYLPVTARITLVVAPTVILQQDHVWWIRYSVVRHPHCGAWPLLLGNGTGKPRMGVARLKADVVTVCPGRIVQR